MQQTVDNPNVSDVSGKIFNESDRALRPARIPIQKSPEEIYEFIRDPQNMKLFVKSLKDIAVTPEGQWRWIFEKDDSTREWLSEVIVDEPNKLLAWKTIAPTYVGDIGAIGLTPDPTGRGTYVTLKFGKDEKNPGKFTGVVSQLVFGGNAKSVSFMNIRRLKAYLETGEVPTIDGQPHGTDENKH